MTERTGDLARLVERAEFLLKFEVFVIGEHRGLPARDDDGVEVDLGAQLALDLVSDKWTILIIHSLSRGTRRFSELQREIEGISQRMLIFTLRNMERDGLLTRKVYPVVPPRTEYTLTPLGQTLWEPLHNLCLWAEKYFDQVLECRRKNQEETAGR